MKVEWTKGTRTLKCYVVSRKNSHSGALTLNNPSIDNLWGEVTLEQKVADAPKHLPSEHVIAAGRRKGHQVKIRKDGKINKR